MKNSAYIKSGAAFIAAAMMLSGCASSGNVGVSAEETSLSENTSSDTLNIVCTIFPEYDWTMEILGDNADRADITYLLGSGADLHSFQPSAADIVKISSCDIFMYVGGESDEWAEDALKEAVSKDIAVIDLMDIVGSSAKEEELKEGMQSEEHEEDHHGDEEEPEYDEHVWLSLSNAELICQSITDALCEKDPDNAAEYKNNLAAYSGKLRELDGKFTELFENSAQKTLIFGDRFPFRYFTDDYGLDYYAAFAGCSAETEASFGTITFLAEKADELGVDTIYTIENSDGKIARSIIENSDDPDRKTAVLDSAQSVSHEQIGTGVSYLSIMQSNYEVLRQDLG